jgi:hypothetical protein
VRPNIPSRCKLKSNKLGGWPLKFSARTIRNACRSWRMIVSGVPEGHQAVSEGHQAVSQGHRAVSQDFRVSRTEIDMMLNY